MGPFFRRHKYFRYVVYCLGGFLALILVLFLVLSTYVYFNKKKLVDHAASEIGTLIGGNIQIGDITVSILHNFPNLSIALKNITVSDSLVAQNKHPLIHAETIFVRLNLFKLLTRKVSLNKIEIENAGFYLFTDSSGYTNGYLLQRKNKQESPQAENEEIDNILNKIEVHNVTVTLEDRIKGKLFDFDIHSLYAQGHYNDSTIIFNLKNSILIKDLGFNLPKGSFAHGKMFEGEFAVRYAPRTKSLSFEDIPVEISNHAFAFSGAFVFGTAQQFSLKIVSKDILVDFAKTLLTEKIAKSISIVTVKAPVDVVASISGGLQGGEPLIVVDWNTKNNAVTSPFLNFDSCAFSGRYCNEVVKGLERDDSNSSVAILKLRGKWQGMQVFSDSVLIRDLTKPVVDCNMHSQFALDALNGILASDAITLSGGTGAMDIVYHGPIDHFTKDNATLSGKIAFANGNILMTASQATLTDCKANIYFQNGDIAIDTLLCKIGGNPIRMWGTARNTLSLLGQDPNDVRLEWNVAAPLLNIDHLSSIVSRKFPAKKRAADKNMPFLAKTVHQFDELLANGNVSVKINADRLVYHKFEANNISASIQIKENEWNLSQCGLAFGKGTIQVAAKVVEQQTNVFVLNALIDMNNLDAQKVLYGFDNFGMPTPTYKNLKGKLTLHSKLSVRLHKTGDFDLNTLNGQADVSIRDGELVDFEPAQKLQIFLFKNRDFSHIKFAEIKDKFAFKRGEIDVSRMEVNSSVLSLFLEGNYSTNGQNTDLSIQLPLSNLGKREKEYKPENVGAGSKGGMSVFIRAKTGEDGKIKIQYDMLKRFRKSK